MITERRDFRFFFGRETSLTEVKTIVGLWTTMGKKNTNIILLVGRKEGIFCRDWYFLRTVLTNPGEEFENYCHPVSEVGTYYDCDGQKLEP